MIFVIVPVVPVVNATVADTPVAATRLLDKVIGKAVNIAGNSTPVKVSMVALDEPVVIETVVAKPRAVPAFLSPATVHVKEVPLETV